MVKISGIKLVKVSLMYKWLDDISIMICVCVSVDFGALEKLKSWKLGFEISWKTTFLLFERGTLPYM